MILEELNRAIEQLLGRTDGPMQIRLLLQPIMAIFLATRAGLRDAREGKPPFLWYVIKNAQQRRKLFWSAWKDIGRLIIVAFLVDSLYQLIVFQFLYPLQALLVTLVLAVLPYLILRGIVTRLTRRYMRRS